MGRIIDADAFERNMQNEWERNEISNGEWIHFREMLNAEPTIEPERKWIPFKDRELLPEEMDEYPTAYRILDCKLPEDGQRILISVNMNGHERVQGDEFYNDGNESYLDSGYELCTEAVAWMPLPECWIGEE